MKKYLLVLLGLLVLTTTTYSQELTEKREIKTRKRSTKTSKRECQERS